MITFQDKVSLNTDPSIADINKIKDSDINALKVGVNTNETNIGTLQTNVTNITGELLWTNDTPTVDISTRTITLSSNDYDILEIFFCYSKTNNESVSSVRIPKGKDAQLLVIQPTNYFSFVGRTMTYNSDTSYTINQGLLCQGANNTVTSNTTGCIPLWIVGYKTGVWD